MSGPHPGPLPGGRGGKKKEFLLHSTFPPNGRSNLPAIQYHPFTIITIRFLTEDLS
jgi:hypothetical protein